MNKKTGKIKDYSSIPKEEIDLGKWSKPFHVGEVVPFKGVYMKIIKIKKLKKEIHLKFHGV